MLELDLDILHADLVERASRQDRDAFTELYECYERPLKKRLFALVNDRELADDLFHDTMTSVLEYFLRPESAARRIERFGNWLYTVARNKAFDDLKRQRKIGFTPLPDSSEHDQFAALSAEGDEDRICERLALEAAVAQMSPQYRECLLRYACQGLSYQEIAASMHISESAVGTNIRNARRQLRALLECAGDSTAGDTRRGGTAGSHPDGTHAEDSMTCSQWLDISQQQKGGISNMGCIGFLIWRFNQVFNVSKTRAAVVAILCFVAGFLLMPLGGNFFPFYGACFGYGLIYGCIWYYKFNRDRRIVERAQLEAQQAPQAVAPPMSRPGGNRYFVPKQFDRP